MTGRRRFSILALVLCLAAAAGAESITLQADYWMPFNGDGVKETGYMIDVLREVFGRQGITVNLDQVPWSRAVAQARAGQSDGVVGALREDAKGFVFPAEELGRSEIAFFVKKGEAWRYAGPESLKGRRLGAIASYAYSAELDAYIAANPQSVALALGEEPITQLLAFVSIGRVDVFVEERAVARYALKKAGLAGNFVEAGSLGGDQRLYVAFSPAKPQSERYAKLLTDGVAALRKSGRLREILAKYGLEDWK